jgi:hypothetical protein
MHSGKLSSQQPVPHRSERWLLPVRPMALARPVGTSSQAGGKQQMHNNIPGSLMTPLGPGTKTTTKTQPARKENSSQNLANQLQTSQELTSRTTGHNLMNTTAPRDKNPPGACTGLAGHTWAARDEQRRGSTSSNPTTDLLIHSTNSHFGDSKNTSWALRSQVMVHQNSLNQEESKDFCQEHHEPYTNENPKIEPLCSQIWEGNQTEKNHKGFKYTSPTKSKRERPQNHQRKSLRKGSENHQKGETRTTPQDLEGPRRIIYTYHLRFIQGLASARSSFSLTRSHHQALKLVL